VNAETLMRTDAVACIQPDTLDMLRAAPSSREVQHVPAHRPRVACQQDKHVALYVAPSVDVLDLIEDMMEFVREAECKCYQAEGNYEGHTCRRCSLLARLTQEGCPVNSVGEQGENKRV
jgi:hypothetical protein